MSVQIGKDGTIIRSSHTQSNYTPAPSRYTPPSHDSFTVIFYIITLVISAVVSWLIAGLIGVPVFKPGSGSGMSGFFKNIGPYMVFLGGIAGCFWYNIKYSDYYDFKEGLLSVVSCIVSCLIFGVGGFIISVVIQIIIVIIIVIIAIGFFAGS